MPTLLSTVDDLVSEVRSKLDEDDNDALDTDTDILPALNRAQDHAANILARHYPVPYLKKLSVSLSGETSELTIPEDSFEDRLLAVEVETSSGNYHPIDECDYTDLWKYQSSGSTSVPSRYALYGRKYILAPKSNGSKDLRIWYMGVPEALVLSQGRITTVDATYLKVDALGADLTTENDALNNIINVIDGQTGEIRATYEIASIDTATKKITIQSTPTDATVLGRTISSTITLTGDNAVQKNDYVCLVKGTCVPRPMRPLRNFLIQFATAELSRPAGGDYDIEVRVLDSFEKQVEKYWVGRPTPIRVKLRSGRWGGSGSSRRWYPSQS